jgi:hypothetical protein
VRSARQVVAPVAFLLATVVVWASRALGGAPAPHAPHTAPIASSSAPPEPSAASSAAPSAAPAPAPPPADDARFDSDGAMPPHADDVVDYKLRASLDPVRHTVHGEGTITWRNTSSVPVKELWVHLYLNAFKNQRSFWLRTPGWGLRGSLPVQDWGAIDVRKFTLRDDLGISTDLWGAAELHRPGDTDETDVHVPLPREVAPGEKIQIDVAWDDKMPSIVERTGYLERFHMMGQWFPKIARLEPDGTWAHFPFGHAGEFYADYGTYDVTLDVPQGYVIGATGPTVDAHMEGGRRIERHVQSDVHDFAWTAWDEWQVDREIIDGVRVTVLYPPSFKADAARELRTMRFALPDFGAHYGRYPYEVITLVHPPSHASEAGGMEYPTLITTGGPWYGPPGLFLLETTVMHEFAHQYFYGLVGSDEVHWPFLDEGLATYAEDFAMGTWLGPGSAADLFGLDVGRTDMEAIFANETAHDAKVAQPAYAFEHGTDVGGLVYARTGTIFETLRRTYGSELVGRALGRYARKYRFGHPGPEELIGVVREVMGDKVAATLRTALFDEGWVDFAVQEASSAPAREPAGLFDRDGKRETVLPKGSPGWDGSVLVQRHGTLALPVVIELTRADGSKERVPWDGEASEIRVPYHGDVALRAVVVDPENHVMLDQDPKNNFMTALAQPRAGAPRTFERVLYWMELAQQTVLP